MHLLLSNCNVFIKTLEYLSFYLLLLLLNCICLYFFKSENKLVTYLRNDIKKDLVSLKTKLDNLNVDKLETVPSDLSKLSNVVDSDVLKKTMYDKLIAKVTVIDTKINNKN